jgi:thiamine biosynthesis lipoprotein
VNKRRILYRQVLLISGAVFCYFICSAQPKKYSFSRPKMGSPFNLVMVTDDPKRAETFAEQAYKLIDSFNHIFSDYENVSELSQLNLSAGKGKAIAVSPALWDIIMLSRDAYLKTAGAFDISVGPLSHLWRRARRSKVFAAPDSVLYQKQCVGFNKIKIDTIRHTILLPLSGMYLDLGGVAKGYIAQKVIDRLRSQGITQVLADAGGDIAMSGAPPGTKGWVVGVNIPETTDSLQPRRLVLHDKAVATSGDAYQYIEHEGRRYSHIIDPRTGYGVQSQRNVTVIASNGGLADWLATACSILPIASAKKLANAFHAEVLIGTIKNGKTVYQGSKPLINLICCD